MIHYNGFTQEPCLISEEEAMRLTESAFRLAVGREFPPETSLAAAIERDGGESVSEAEMEAAMRDNNFGG